MRHTPAPTVLVLPESAHLDLIQIRDHLRLLARLTDTGTAASEHDNLLRPDSLAWWFSRLARDLEEIVDATYWSADVAASTPRPT
jgi:hypothetical protein